MITRIVPVIERRVIDMHLHLSTLAVSEMKRQYACKTVFGDITSHCFNKQVAVLVGGDEVTERSALNWPSIVEEEHRRQVRAWLHDNKVWSKVEQAVAKTVEKVQETAFLLFRDGRLLQDVALGQPFLAKVRVVAASAKQ
mmetsp:Transcript_63174/g.175854  ORF Transcript_63174/g.175854 Transcript_63174/m.175854 type:complete len:140 (-) Transcript_63174:345-764(-)